MVCQLRYAPPRGGVLVQDSFARKRVSHPRWFVPTFYDDVQAGRTRLTRRAKVLFFINENKVQFIAEPFYTYDRRPFRAVASRPDYRCNTGAWTLLRFCT